ncbi:MAG: periplasmic heavy metal sensor, partial [Candidatus Hydrogenedentota bacterium]
RPPSPSEEKAIVTNLELTEEQKSEMQKLSQSYKADVQELADRYQKAREDLTAAIQIGNPDPARVSNEVKRVHQTHSALLEKEAYYWIALASILTKDQAVEFWKLFAKSRIMRGKGVSED